ncbi:MAG TPA: ATP-binding protein [Anaerolineales bacterium]|nr:ATP-binding protein [Anaerolineales bacterium]
MSKQNRYQKRLEEIFSETELLECKPQGVPDWVEAASLGNLDATGWLLEPLDILPEAPDLADQNAGLANATLIQTGDGGEGFRSVMQNEPAMEAEKPKQRAAQIGWEDYLDAIQRGEQVGFSYQRDQDLFQPSPTAAERMDSGGQGASKGNLLTVPLVLGEENLGTIELEGAADRPWSEVESGLVASVMQQMALHLENLRLLSQADQYRQEAEQAVRRMTRQGWEEYLETQSRPAAGYVYDRDRVKPLEAASHSNGRQRSRNAKNGMFATHTIRVREETIGELVVESAKGKVNEELLRAVADRLGTHIESLRLLEETERSRQQLDRRAAELETVARVSTAAATILDPQNLLQSVVDLTKVSFKLYHVHIYILDDKATRLALVAGSGEVGQAMLADQHGIDLDDAHSLIAKAAQTRRGMVLQDVSDDPDYRHHPLLMATRSELEVPMIVGDEVIGVFGVLAETPSRFGEDEMRTFSTLAAQAAVALRNAELYAKQMATVERLRELDHLKSAFLANMSHELRTPLNSILGFAQVILEGIDGPLTEDMENDLGLIAKNGKYLLNLINDVLDMAKIEAGRMSLTLESFDLRELIEDVLDTTSPLARHKELYLSLEANPLENWGITADRFRLRQILLNIVGNAIKFTEQGGVTVKAEKRETQILVCIQDTGIGIPPERLEDIFEAFSQVDTSTTRKVGGTGLGLPISRRLVELHGGRLWAESSGHSGEGSIFWLELPVETSEQNPGVLR